MRWHHEAAVAPKRSGLDGVLPYRAGVFCLLLSLLLMSAPRASAAAGLESNAVEALPLSSKARSPQAPEVLGLMLQAVANLETHVLGKALGLLHNEDLVVNAGLASLLAQSTYVPRPQREQFLRDVTNLAQQISALHLSGDLQRQEAAERELRTVKDTFQRLLSYFPKAVVASAQVEAAKHLCPTHPDQVGNQGDLCSKCGQPLDQQLRLLPEFCGVPLTGGAFIQSTVHVARPLIVGEPTRATLRLTHTNGLPVYGSDLNPSHGERIHLFLID